tara:strand:+ start:1198 stop:1593 length:396 start_codon:yes stop_codon:yes gene_type:complete
MGMNFLMAKFPRFTLHEDRRVALRDIIDTLSEDELGEYRDMWLPESESYTDVKEDFLLAICEASQMCNQHTAECVQHNSDGERYHAIFAGGMSWGDPPSESYDVLDRASASHELYTKCLGFAVEDCKYCVT